MYKRKGIQESEPEVTSFFPEPDDGECLAVPGGQRGCRGTGGVCVTPRCLSRSGKFAHHPLPACRRLWPAVTKTDPTVSTALRGGGRGRRRAAPARFGLRPAPGGDTGSARRNFELPWLDERSRCRLEMQKKQTPHRTCRK